MTEAQKTGRTGVALIGAGMIAPVQIAALSAASSLTRLEAIVSRRPERAKHLAQYYAGNPPLFSNDIANITENPDVQVAIVATPPNVRIELIETLAKTGIHILLEKPVGRTLDEAVQVVEICERAGVLLGVVFQHRMRDSAKAAAQLVKSESLGTLGLVEMAVPLWREQSYYDEADRGTYARDGGGALITQAIHTIDLALSLTGDVSSVQAMTATTPLHRMESEDFAVAGLRFASGAVGSLVASTAVFPHRRETITLHCEHGSLYLGAHTLDVHWRDGRQQRITPEAGKEGDPTVAKHAWHQAVIENFIDAVQRGREPLVSGRAALPSHRLIEAIEESSRSGAPVSIQR